MNRRIPLVPALAAVAALGVASCGATPGPRSDAGASAKAQTPRAGDLPARVGERVPEPAQDEPSAKPAAQSDDETLAPPTSPASSTLKTAEDNGPTSDAAVSAADVLKNGIALPPIEAPAAVREIIEAGNNIARTPYVWGGGHGKWVDSGYDCSGSISFALASAGLLNAPLDSGRLMSWGKAGRGKWVTIYTNPGHVFMVVAGVRFDTSGARVTGSRWQSTMRTSGSFVARHPAGL